MSPTINPYDASQILSPGSGYLRDYDYSLNPYVGCAFGCTYCYAAFFAPPERRTRWGDWVRVKRNALDKLSRVRRPLSGKTIYLSSATDPYQPIERRLKLTRSLLPILAERGVRLVVQTRSPLVVRDIDLFAEFDDVCVNFSVTTDSEAVRRAFEPRNPPISARLQAATEVASAGIPVAITMTPLLPLDDPQTFADRVLRTGASRFAVEHFTRSVGQFRAGTSSEARLLAKCMAWDQSSYQRARDALLDQLAPHICEGEAGFHPDFLLNRPQNSLSPPS